MKRKWASALFQKVERQRAVEHRGSASECYVTRFPSPCEVCYQHRGTRLWGHNAEGPR